MVEQLLPKNKIYLDQEIKTKYPSVKLDETDESFLNIDQHKLRPTCYLCGDYNVRYYYDITKPQPPRPTLLPLWIRCASYEHFYCPNCFQYSFNLKGFDCTCTKGEPILTTTTMAGQFWPEIKFECRWDGCKKIFGGSNLKKHEISCEAQPKRECPVDGCQWSGRIDQILDHFKDHENSEIMLGNLALTMKSGKDYYLWILGQFVLVRYQMEELGEVIEHKIKLEVCKDLLDGVKPVGLVSAEGILLKKIEGGDAVKSIRKNVNLFVYFEAGIKWNPLI